MNELLQRIADYFIYQYKGNDEVAPKMDISVDDLRNIAALNIEKCKLETKLRNLQQVKTNADRIRNMSDEELLDFICSIETYEEGSVKTIENGVSMHTVTEVREWLQSEAE